MVSLAIDSFERTLKEERHENIFWEKSKLKSCFRHWISVQINSDWFNVNNKVFLFHPGSAWKKKSCWKWYFHHYTNSFGNVLVKTYGGKGLKSHDEAWPWSVNLSKTTPNESGCPVRLGKPRSDKKYEAGSHREAVNSEASRDLTKNDLRLAPK